MNNTCFKCLAIYNGKKDQINMNHTVFSDFLRYLFSEEYTKNEALSLVSYNDAHLLIKRTLVKCFLVTLEI